MNMNHIRPISWLSGYFKIPLAMGGILILVDILILLISAAAAAVLTIILIGYFGITGRVYFNHRNLLGKELVRFAESYNTVEGKVLQGNEDSLCHSGQGRTVHLAQRGLFGHHP